MDLATWPRTVGVPQGMRPVPCVYPPKCVHTQDCQNRPYCLSQEFAMASQTKPAKSPSKPARHAFASTLKNFKTASGKAGQFYSLPALAKQFPQIKRLPVSIDRKSVV